MGENVYECYINLICAKRDNLFADIRLTDDATMRERILVRINWIDRIYAPGASLAFMDFMVGCFSSEAPNRVAR